MEQQNIKCYIQYGYKYVKTTHRKILKISVYRNVH